MFGKTKAHKSSSGALSPKVLAAFAAAESLDLPDYDPITVYACPVCKGDTITRDTAKGLKPSTIPCYATANCKGHAQADPTGETSNRKHSYEWSRPDPSEMSDGPGLMHIATGVLFMHPVGTKLKIG